MVAFGEQGPRKVPSKLTRAQRSPGELTETQTRVHLGREGPGFWVSSKSQELLVWGPHVGPGIVDTRPGRPSERPPSFFAGCVLTSLDVSLPCEGGRDCW